MRKKKNPAAVATASGGGGFDLAERQIRPVANPERPRLQGQHLDPPIRIDVAPTESGRKWRATFDGKVLCTSASPLITSARLLVANGVDPNRTIEMWHQHADAWALRALLRVAAGMDVAETPFGPKFVRYRPPTKGGVDCIKSTARAISASEGAR
jgi:hypothetical protein